MSVGSNCARARVLSLELRTLLLGGIVARRLVLEWIRQATLLTGSNKVLLERLDSIVHRGELRRQQHKVLTLVLEHLL